MLRLAAAVTRGGDTSGPRRNLDIDRLRAVAIVLVMASHLPALLPTFDDWYRQVNRLWFGVDLFFCISGFVVAGALLPKLDLALRWRGDVGERRRRIAATLKIFFVHRAFRILPLSWLWLAILIVAAATFNETGALGSAWATVEAIPSILTYWYNLWAYLHPADPTLAGVYWSLSVEEQFYILFPLLLLAVASPRGRLAVLLALVAVQFALPRPVLSLAWLMRTDAIALGVCLFICSQAQWYARLEPTFLRKRFAGPALVAAAALLFVAAIKLTPRFADVIPAFPGNVGAIALASAVLVFVASFDRDYLLLMPALKRPLDWIGTRSYGLYLAHLPVWCATREFWFGVASAAGAPLDQRHTWPMALTGIVALAIITELLYRGVERPLRDFGRRLAERNWRDAASGLPHGIEGTPAAGLEQPAIVVR